MTIAEQLAANSGRQVTLEFEDGEIVDAILIEVDPTEHLDLVYDVLAVRRAISAEQYPRSNVYVALISSVVAVDPVE